LERSYNEAVSPRAPRCDSAVSTQPRWCAAQSAVHNRPGASTLLLYRFVAVLPSIVSRMMSQVGSVIDTQSGLTATIPSTRQPHPQGSTSTYHSAHRRKASVGAAITTAAYKAAATAAAATHTLQPQRCSSLPLPTFTRLCGIVCLQSDHTQSDCERLLCTIIYSDSFAGRMIWMYHERVRFVRYVLCGAVHM